MSLAGSPWFLRAAATMAGFLYPPISFATPKTVDLYPHSEFLTIQPGTVCFVSAMHSQHGPFKLCMHGCDVLESIMQPVFLLLSRSIKTSSLKVFRASPAARRKRTLSDRLCPP
jgi:hypothetical protein